MAFSLENLKIDKKTIEEKVNSAAKLLQIEDYLQRKPKLYLVVRDKELRLVEQL
jgi:ABC-type sugar transport system ATPase subunit